jgi:hypothetical protein
VRFAIIRPIWFASFSALITFFTSTAAQADIGIAAGYPGDKNIGSDPAVILADDFESYTALSGLATKWTKVQHPDLMRLVTSAAEPNHVYSGTKALEMALPISTIELQASLVKTLATKYNTVYIRMYHKFDAGYDL